VFPHLLPATSGLLILYRDGLGSGVLSPQVRKRDGEGSALKFLLMKNEAREMEEGAD